MEIQTAPRLRLEDVTPDNWRQRLEVAEEQKGLVANQAILLARAYAYRDLRSRAFFLYDEKTPVGMGLYYDCPERDGYIFSQLFIDARYQRQGYGRAAVQLVLDALKQDQKYHRVLLCYEEGNEVARRLYASFGFVETEKDEDEIIMELSWEASWKNESK